MTGYYIRWYLINVDWRISTGIIFSIMLMLYGRGEKRSRFGGRLALGCMILCTGSFGMRYAVENWLDVSPVLQGAGYSLFILLMSALYLLCHAFCRRTTRSDLWFNGAVALTVYRIAWDTLKACTYAMRIWGMPWRLPSIQQAAFSYAVYAAACILCAVCYRRFVKAPLQVPAQQGRNAFSVMLACQMLLEVILQSINKGAEKKYMFTFFVCSLLYSAMSYAMLLMYARADYLRYEKGRIEDFVRSKQEYYQVSREGMLALQTKCHDLKHQIRLIRSAEGQRQFDAYLDRLDSAIDEYSTVFDTGNQPLDVVLMEKNLLCLNKGIRLTCMLDGALFSFLTEMEIYALFGNIMDNAIESMENALQRENCFIDLKAAERGGMVILNVENYYEGELRYQRGQLVTTKDEQMHHGFGLRSIRDIAASHGGTVSISAENHIFRLTVGLQRDSSIH